MRMNMANVSLFLQNSYVLIPRILDIEFLIPSLLGSCVRSVVKSLEALKIVIVYFRVIVLLDMSICMSPAVPRLQEHLRFLLEQQMANKTSYNFIW